MYALFNIKISEDGMKMSGVGTIMRIWPLLLVLLAISGPRGRPITRMDIT